MKESEARRILNEFVDSIQHRKSEKGNLEGRVSAVTERLKEDFKLTSLKKAKDFINAETEKLGEMRETLMGDTEKILEELTWE